MPGSDSTYGLDPLLYNGKMYTYRVPPGTKGNPFLHGNEFIPGTATVRGVTFKDLQLKYDILNQQLILHYQKDGSEKDIVLAETWLESFTLGHSVFAMDNGQDTTRRIFQEIGNGPYQFYLHWDKDIALDSKPGERNYIFSNPEKLVYIKDNNGLTKLANNKSFIRHFEESKQPAIKKYLQVKQIKVLKASEKALKELIDHVNTLVKK